VQFKYGLDDRPPLGTAVLFGAQWFALLIPVIIVIGKICSGLHAGDHGGQITYLQRLAFLMAVALVVQIVAGHRLPLIVGPSTVLLIGIIANRDFSIGAINAGILMGGVVLFLVSVTGLFGHIKRLFTPRVVAAVLLLIAFTLLPTVGQLITAGNAPLISLLFALTFTLCLFALHHFLKGIAQTTLIVWAMIGGSILFFLLRPEALQQELRGVPAFSAAFLGVVPRLSFAPGVTISFLVCFLALAANDLGSIQSLNELLHAPEPGQRVTRGMAITGLANAAAGLLGVIGPVNFSMSPGVIMASGCASRFTLLPAAAILLLVSFSPTLLGLAGLVPPPVIGSILLYTSTLQVGAGLLVLSEAEGDITMSAGLVVGAPLLMGTVVAFLPTTIVRNLPALLQPLLGNGFVVGITAAILLEQLVLRSRH